METFGLFHKPLDLQWDKFGLKAGLFRARRWHGICNNIRNADQLFKVILRYLTRKLFFTGLNVAGLSIGLACIIVIFLFIQNELLYDKFQKDGDQIYRVISSRQSMVCRTTLASPLRLSHKPCWKIFQSGYNR